MPAYVSIHILREDSSMHRRAQLCRTLLAFVLLPYVSGCSHSLPKTTPRGGLPPSPLLSVLDQFTAPDVPRSGPVDTPRTWPEPTNVPDMPGGGIARHPML